MIFSLIFSALIENSIDYFLVILGIYFSTKTAYNFLDSVPTLAVKC